METGYLAIYFGFQCDLKKIDECSYLKLPSMKSDINIGEKNKKISSQSGNFHFSRQESFKIGFQLCSTKLAQNGIVFF